MATRNGVIGLLRKLAAPAGTDAELLGRFAAAGDPDAFEALVHRHAAMVFGVCRRVLRNDADAEDAFQATFLVLARKAAEVVNRAALSGWLYGVAYRTALKLRTDTLNRRAKEANVPARQPACGEPALPGDLGAVLDEELQHLSDAYRDAILLCDVEGLSRRDAATRLGVPEGTLSGQLSRARRLLADRLRRRGVTLAAGLAALALGQAAQAAPPAALSGVVAAAKAFAAGLPLAEASVSARVVTLTTGVLKAMYLQKLVSSMAALALVALVALGLAGYATFGAPTPKAESPAAKADGGPVNLQLLTHRKVIRELKCTEDQWDRIDDVLEKAAAQTVTEFNAAARAAGPGGPPPARPDIGRIADTHGAAAQKAIMGKILLPAQVVRLRQIDRQARGPWAFQRSEVEAALKLTGGQKAKVKELIAEVLKQAAKNRDALNAGGGAVDPASWMPDTAPTVKAILKELSAEQTATWKELTGEAVKFDLKKISGVHQYLTAPSAEAGPAAAPGGGGAPPGGLGAPGGPPPGGGGTGLPGTGPPGR